MNTKPKFTILLTAENTSEHYDLFNVPSNRRNLSFKELLIELNEYFAETWANEMPEIMEIGLNNKGEWTYIIGCLIENCTFVPSLTEESKQYTLSELIDLLPYFNKCFKNLYCVQIPELGDLLR